MLLEWIHVASRNSYISKLGNCAHRNMSLHTSKLEFVNIQYRICTPRNSKLYTSKIIFAHIETRIGAPRRSNLYIPELQFEHLETRVCTPREPIWAPRSSNLNISKPEFRTSQRSNFYNSNLEFHTSKLEFAHSRIHLHEVNCEFDSRCVLVPCAS